MQPNETTPETGTTAVATQPRGPKPSLNLPANTMPGMFVPTGSIFSSDAAFERAGRMANVLAQSTIVPKQYQGKTADVLVALDLAGIVGVPALMVMQNLDIISGKPSWGAKFVIAAIRGCGRFDKIHFEHGTGEPGTVPFGNGATAVQLPNITCRMVATDVQTGQVINGTTVSISMALKEGWYGKTDSKWQSMPEQMLQYRAGSFFGRLHIPDILLGMADTDELRDSTRTAPVYADAGTGAEELPSVRLGAGIGEPTADAGTGVVVEPAKRATRARRGAPAPVEVPSTPEAEPEGAQAAETTQAAPVMTVAREAEPEGEAGTGATVEETPAPAALPVQKKVPTPAEQRAATQAAQYPETVAAQPKAAPAPATAQPNHANPETWPVGFVFITEDGEEETAENKDTAEPLGVRLRRFNEQLQYFLNKQPKQAPAAQLALDVETPEADSVQMPNPNGTPATEGEGYW